MLPLVMKKPLMFLRAAIGCEYSPSGTCVPISKARACNASAIFFFLAGSVSRMNSARMAISLSSLAQPSMGVLWFLLVKIGEQDSPELPEPTGTTLAWLVGAAVLTFLGVVLSLNIDVVVPAIERAFNFQILSREVYYISELPSQLVWRDVWMVACVALGLAFLATLYPSWRAARVNPAEALRYE